MEACGTSGMKASLNGTLHFSGLDGWWPEGYTGENGWKIGEETSDDSRDANAIYDTLENEIVPLFYRTGKESFPKAWAEKMKKAIMSISPHFSARRMMKDYLEMFYVPISKKIKE